MRRTIAIVALVCSGFATAACGRGTGAGEATREALGAIDEVRSEPRSFLYEDESLDGKTTIVVKGLVQDDLKYSGTVAINGKDVFQGVVSDDSVALRLVDLDRTGEAIAAADKVDPITARALREGKWVVDHTVAPPLLAAAAAADDEEATADRPDAGAGRRRENLVGDEPFTDGAQALNYTERALRSGFTVEEFNPDDVQYNALDDPWRADADKDLLGKGITRYDLLLPGLPGQASRGRQQQLPQIEHFRKMAVYVQRDRVFEVREQIDLSDRREFRRAESGRQAEFFLELRDDALNGALQDELRQRKMRYRVSKAEDVEVKLPDGAVEGLLADVLPELKKMYGYEFIGGTGANLLPGVSPAPAASPGASGAPAASPAASASTEPSS